MNGDLNDIWVMVNNDMLMQYQTLKAQTLTISNVASINLETGDVTLHTSPNEAANAFWKAVTHMFPRNKI